jgi:hypothetical protein
MIVKRIRLIIQQQLRFKYVKLASLKGSKDLITDYFLLKNLEYIDLTKEEFFRLRRFDKSLPLARKGVRWRKRIQNGWLVGEYVREVRREPLKIYWYMADLTGQYQRVLLKDW